jgi:hypothetical protein
MKVFTLSSTVNVMRNGEVEITLKPSDVEIENYLSTFVIYNNESEALADLNRLIVEQTPIMYEAFQSTDNVSQEIKDKYQL